MQPGEEKEQYEPMLQFLQHFDKRDSNWESEALISGLTIVINIKEGLLLNIPEIVRSLQKKKITVQWSTF